ncbi:sulfatase-like hydrolase/transferase [Burkholderia aenigmatica]|uniref:sulfatase-like hydrolase/transferase n=1 Tax=Burkholderia aenigmatica TaxID=2015348 RepID=UPI001F00F81B|nr:sulfatase-like hydrolase/transferase [Burkholderia aenigmatica]UKD15835.1 sulfatase-like hydrolase/transferase [Burkholderia aenigmatica]
MQDDANNRTNRQATEHDDTADRPNRDDARASQWSRRHFLKLAGASVASAGIVSPAIAMQPAPSAPAADQPAPDRAAATVAPATPPAGYNILFILTDQEQHFDRWPFPVPGRERLRREGITFDNHQIAACVCTPSRSTIYTGQHIQHTRMFDNCGIPWQADMSTDIRTIGHMMKDAGYHATYLGKWHLSNKFHHNHSPYDVPVAEYNSVMKSYGFDDYVGVGDLIGLVRGGYTYDGMTAASTVSWLRSRAEQLDGERKPWFLAVNLVNPHDAMFLNTDPPGSNQQNAKRPMLGNARAPRDAIYDAHWNVPLAPTHDQPYDAPGRPAAHGVYNSAEGLLVGDYALDATRLKVYQDYYFNCIRDCDTHVVRILDALRELGLDQNTIVVMSSDHGDHVGAHKLVGKGPTAYREQNNVPLVIRHPAYPGGKRCQALTSHIDVTPTLLGLTGLDAAAIAKIAGSAVRGNNLAPLLREPERHAPDAVRSAALFNYAMLLFYDSEWLAQEVGVLRDRGLPPDELQRRVAQYQPDYRHRGMIRSVYDGRYRFSRYFSATNFNRPDSLETLFANNDVELFDLHDDPHEQHNLALAPKANGELLLAMNAKLSASLDAEFGDDRADILPIRDGRVQFNFGRHA